MPIYIIHCLDCGRIAEEFFPTIDVTKWKCQACGSDKKEKLPARSSFRLHNEKCGGFTHNSSKTPSAG
jgi:putative FmdB family regulatory protein